LGDRGEDAAWMRYKRRWKTKELCVKLPGVMEKVEVHQINRQFEYLRLKDARAEQRLLNQILEEGLNEPLGCLFKEDRWILLDGFKRLRCCVKLKVHKVTVMNLGQDEADAILQVLRRSTLEPIHIIEQAGMVEYLHRNASMGISEIARYLNRSPAWVSVRAGLIGQMSKTVREAVFSGKLPVRSVMYSLKPFTRVKSQAQEVDDFVGCVAGQGLSVRQIDALAGAYFQNNPVMRDQIREGQLNWTLNQIKAMGEESESKPSAEPMEFRQLQWLYQSMRKVTNHCGLAELRQNQLWPRAQSTIKAILDLMPVCQKILEDIVD
jgi:ParB-like chromosome segregation protein Spo0J